MIQTVTLRSIARHWVVGGVGVFALHSAIASGQLGFTVEQALRAPYAVSLCAAREGSRFAWVEVQEGRHNLWVGAAGEPARALTHYTGDDGQELREVTWLPGGKLLAFTRGPENGADGKPANAAHLQPPARVEVWLAESHGTGEPKLVGEGHAPLPLPDGKHLLMVRSGQVWLADLDTADTAPPETHTEKTQRPLESTEQGLKEPHGLPMRQLVFDRGAASGLTLSPEGRVLAFISRRDHNHSFLGLFDLQTHVLSFPAASTGNDSAPVFSPDSRQLAWLRSPWTEAPEFAANRISANPWSIEMLELASGRSRTLFRPEVNRPGSVLPHVSSGEPRLWWFPHGLLFASEADTWVHLYALDPSLAEPKPALLTPGPFEVEDPAVSPDGRSLVYTANTVSSPDGNASDADRRHLWYLDLTTPGLSQQGPKQPGLSQPGPMNSAARPVLLTAGNSLETHPVFSGDSARVAALRADWRIPNQPTELRALKPGSETVALADATAQAEDQKLGAQLRALQPVFFPSADKLFTLHGQLFQPASSGPPAVGVSSERLSSARKPALLFFHGGPRRQMLLGFTAMEYYTRAYLLNQYFAAQGFVVLSVNYRGGIGYGLDFREAAGTGADGASEYNDVLGAVAYLRSRPDVDPKRIALWGGSYGGYLTALGLARNSDLFAAGVDFHGVHEWILEDNRSDWLRGTQAEQAAIAEKAHMSSPMADIEKWKSPVLLIHGDNDANVAYAQTPVLADALRSRSVPVEELIFPDEIHEFLLYRDWLAAYKATAEFLERMLGPASAALPK